MNTYKLTRRFCSRLCIVSDRGVQESVESLQSFNYRYYYVIIILLLLNVSSQVKRSELLFPLSRAILALKVD